MSRRIKKIKKDKILTYRANNTFAAWGKRNVDRFIVGADGVSVIYNSYWHFRREKRKHHVTDKIDFTNKN
jgi:hypothetical protein